MATTTILTIHINKGKTPKQCVAAQLNYIMNTGEVANGVRLLHEAKHLPTLLIFCWFSMSA